MIGNSDFTYFRVLCLLIGVGTHQDTIQSPRRLYTAPEDYTKPRQTIQSPPEYKQPYNIRQILKILNKDSIKY